MNESVFAPGSWVPPSLTSRSAATMVPEPSSVIVAVPTLNEEEHIAECLASLYSDPWMATVPVVVADGGSTDATRAIVQELQTVYPSLQLIDNPKRLQSAAVNTVAKRVARKDTQVLVRCDAHATYPLGYVRRVALGLLGRKDAASIVTPMDAHGQGCFPSAAAWVVDTPLGCGGAAHRGGTRSDWVDHGHHAGFRLDWFRTIGGYDETFTHNEDAEYDQRLSDAGGRIWMDARIRIDYRMRRSPIALARQYWNYGRGRARTVQKHRLKPRLRQLIPVANLLAQIAALAVAPVLPIALVLPAIYLGALAAMSAIGVRQLGSTCGLMAGPALFVMHMSWGAGFLCQSLPANRKPDLSLAHERPSH